MAEFNPAETRGGMEYLVALGTQYYDAGGKDEGLWLLESVNQTWCALTPEQKNQVKAVESPNTTFATGPEGELGILEINHGQNFVPLNCSQDRDLGNEFVTGKFELVPEQGKVERVPEQGKTELWPAQGKVELLVPEQSKSEWAWGKFESAPVQNNFELPNQSKFKPVPEKAMPTKTRAEERWETIQQLNAQTNQILLWSFWSRGQF